MTRGSILKSAFALLSEAEAEAVWEALGQYVENETDHEEEHLEETGKAPPHLAAAQTLLDRMNEAIAALAS